MVIHTTTASGIAALITLLFMYKLLISILVKSGHLKRKRRCVSRVPIREALPIFLIGFEQFQKLDPTLKPRNPFLRHVFEEPSS
jgi:hypothetical protein